MDDNGIGLFSAFQDSDARPIINTSIPIQHFELRLLAWALVWPFPHCCFDGLSSLLYCFPSLQDLLNQLRQTISL